MKLRTMILMGGLLLGTTLVIPLSAYSNETLSMEFQRKRHKVHINKHVPHQHSRSVSPIVTGYVEDDFLILSFSYPLEKVPLRIVDAESGETVFDGVVSGSTLSIPLERDSESFDVYIN